MPHQSRIRSIDLEEDPWATRSGSVSHGTDHVGPTVSVLKFLHVRVKYGGNLDCKIRLDIPSSGSNLDWISFLMKFNSLCCEIHARTKVRGKKQMENRDFPVPSVNHT